MADSDSSSGFLISPLGRRIQLGDFYDYRSDRILSVERDDKETAEIASATETQLVSSVEVVVQLGGIWNSFRKKKHLQASMMAGLIDNIRGASCILNERVSDGQVSLTLCCFTRARTNYLKSESIVEKLLASAYGKTNQGTSSEATHAVFGVGYGAYAYYVFTQDLSKTVYETDEELEEDLTEATDNLAMVASLMQNALKGNLDPSDFKGQLNKDNQKVLRLIKCRLYSDLQSQAVRECDIYEAYNSCFQLLSQIRDDASARPKFVPVVAVLFPLQDVADPSKKKLFQYRDIDESIVERLDRIMSKLEHVSVRVKSIRNQAKKNSRPSLRNFENAIASYQQLVKSSLKMAVPKARGMEEDDVDADRELERIAAIIENHSLFKPSRLEKWLLYKESELYFTSKMSTLNGIQFLPGKAQLQKELSEAFDKKYSLVLTVPPLDERSNDILQAMKDYNENYIKLAATDDADADDGESGDDDDEDLPWHMVERKKKFVLAKIRELSDHVQNNKHLEASVQFIITVGDYGEKCSCSYSVYKNDDLLKANLPSLCEPPTGLQIKLLPPENSKARVEWKYEDLGYPCRFLVEFREKDSMASWTQRTTDKVGENYIIMPLKPDSTLEIRVAVDSCIGRSGYSDTIDTDSAVAQKENNGTIDSDFIDSTIVDIKIEPRQSLAETTSKLESSFQANTSVTQRESIDKAPLKPPSNLIADKVTQTTATLTWTSSPSQKGRRQRLSHRISYWPSQQDPSEASEVDAGSATSFRLEDLEPDLSYSVCVSCFSDNGEEISPPSQVIELSTLNSDVRFAEMILKHCKKIGNRNGMDLYGVPLTRSKEKTVERFIFGKADERKSCAQHKTILVMGATGSGKTTLINGMINYIFNVEWQDNFRFQLIQEQLKGRSQVDSQTSRITAYDIHHMEGFRIPYSLTIVDTPGYGDTQGLKRDQEITEMVRKYFEDKGGIQELDVVGFVAPASLPRLTPTQIYIFDSVLSIFGRDIKDNVSFLLTFADSQEPPVLNAIGDAELPCPTDEYGKPLHHKFNNSGFFCSNRVSGGSSASTVDKFNRFFWRMGMENFQRFFSVLATMKTKSLSLTKQVLDERKQLEATVEGLQPLIKIGLAKMEEMRKTNEIIMNNETQLEANENVEFEVDVTMPVKMDIPSGQYLTNCNKCYVTCHNPCAIPNDDGKMDCWAMDFTFARELRQCRICPEKCIWNMHANQPYKWEYKTEKKATSSDAIRQKYEAQLKKTLTAQDLIKVLQKELDDNEEVVCQRVQIVSRCIERLDEIALRPNPFSAPQYIDLIIDAEQQEKRPGFKDRIESLKKLRQMAVITSKIKNKESLLSTNRKDDFDEEEEQDECREKSISNEEEDGVDTDSELMERLEQLKK